MMLLMAMGDTGPDDVEAFIAAAPDDAQAGLRDLRARIAALLPGVQERISYRVPVFVSGRQVVGMGYSAKALSLYTMSPTLAQRLAPQLQSLGCRVTGATVAVPRGGSFPADAVALVLRGRVAELGLAPDAG